PGFVSRLFVPGARATYNVTPAVVPGDTGLPVHHCPGSVTRTDCFCGFAIGFQRNKEVASPAAAHAYLPLSEEVVLPHEPPDYGRAAEFDARRIGQYQTLLMAVFENDFGGRAKVDASNV